MALLRGAAAVALALLPAACAECVSAADCEIGQACVDGTCKTTGAGDTDDAGPDAGDTASDTDTMAPFDEWELIAELDVGGEWARIDRAVAYDGHIYTLHSSALNGYNRFSLVDGAREELLWSGYPDGTSKGGVLCPVGARAYLLGGGGDGVTSTWADYNFEVVDLAEQTWLAGGEHWAPYHLPAIAHDGERCFMVGGSSESGIAEVPSVQELLPASGELVGREPLPHGALVPFAALDGDLLFVAGGGRASADGDPIATTWGVALDQAQTLRLDGPDATWASAPTLPVALANGRALALEGRFFLFGGWPSPEVSPGPLPEIRSWAPGEDGWADEGALPAGEGFYDLRVFHHDGAVYLVVVEYDDGYRSTLVRWLRW
jgi:hypothetical protein